MPYKVGLTGGIGSGKSAVSAMFIELGVPVIDADTIAHALTLPGKPALKKIVSIFGQQILSSTGQLNRKELGKIVFSDNELKRKLEAVLHPLVFDTMEEMTREINAGYCILSIPLLFETDSNNRVDRTLVVDTPVPVQIARICKRDGISPQQAENIIQSQLSRQDRIRLADDVIINDGDLQQLTEKVNALHIKYLEAAKEHTKL